MDKIIISVIGVLGIAFVYWYFLGKKEKEVAVSGSVDILVEGGYTPEAISIKKGETTRLNFLRKDPNSCLEDVVIPDFKIRRNLPLNEKVTIEITPQQTGTYTISCGMNMFHGKIIVN